MASRLRHRPRQGVLGAYGFGLRWEVLGGPRRTFRFLIPSAAAVRDNVLIPSHLSDLHSAVYLCIAMPIKSSTALSPSGTVSQRRRCRGMRTFGALSDPLRARMRAMDREGESLPPPTNTPVRPRRGAGSRTHHRRSAPAHPPSPRAGIPDPNGEAPMGLASCPASEHHGALGRNRHAQTHCGHRGIGAAHGAKAHCQCSRVEAG